MELVVDPSRCVGAGMCALTAPEYFDQDDDGRVRRLKTVDEIDEPLSRAADFCPSGAVRIVGAKTSGTAAAHS